MIRLKHCHVEFTPTGCTTWFSDGTETSAFPHWDNRHYTVVAHRLGYGDDLLAYAREHELCHSLTQEWLHDRPSPVLWGVAHNAMLSGRSSAEEECFAQTFQRFLRSNERPILSGLTKLDEWKASVLAMIEAENSAFLK